MEADARSERICFSYMNALNGMGIFAGATLGGFLATRLNLGLEPILSLFLLPGILRPSSSSRTFTR